METFFKVADKLRKTVADDTRTKPVKASMNHDIDKMQSFIIKLKNAMISEQGKNAGLQSVIKTLKEEIRCTPTYASVARGSLHVQAQEACSLCTKQQKRKNIKRHKRRSDKKDK